MRAAAALGAALLVCGCGSSRDPEPPPLRMLDARAVHTATALPGGNVLLAGGFEREGTPPPSSTEVVRGGQARPAAELGEGRGGHLARMGEGVLVAGGYDAAIQPSAAAAVIG